MLSSAPWSNPMKTKTLFALVLTILLSLAACGPAESTPEVEQDQLFHDVLVMVTNPVSDPWIALGWELSSTSINTEPAADCTLYPWSGDGTFTHVGHCLVDMSGDKATVPSPFDDAYDGISAYYRDANGDVVWLYVYPEPELTIP